MSPMHDTRDGWTRAMLLCEIRGCEWTIQLPERRCADHGGDPNAYQVLTDAFGGTHTRSQDARKR